MTEWGRGHFGLDLRAGHIERAEFAPNRFGLITLWDVLEHLPHPRLAVEQLFAWLAPGGWLVVEVPSEVTTFRRLAEAACALSAGRIVGPARLLYHAAHLSYFTPRSVRVLASAVGASGVTIITKEAHVTRFGLDRFRPHERYAIRALATADRLFGTQAKLLLALGKPAGN